MQFHIDPDNHEHYDVAIVGARVAGAATALLLARAGLDVVVVDRMPPGADTLSTHALMRPAVEQLADWGALEAIRAASTPAVDRTVFHYDNDVFPIALPKDEPLYAPRRTVIDPVMAEMAAEAGAELRFETRLLDVLVDETGRAGGLVVDGPDGPERIRARLIVGADGIRSLVARSVGAGLVHESVNTSACVYGLFEELPDPRSYHWYFSKRASAGVIPTNGGHVVFAAGPQSEFQTVVRDDTNLGFRHWLSVAAPELADELGGKLPVGRLRAFPGRRSFIRRAAGAGWALVGDAGVFTDPMSAHGMTSALRDAELLAAAAVQDLGADDPSAWIDYETVRNGFARPLIDAIDEVVAYSHELDVVQKHHLQLSKVMKAESAHRRANVREARTGLPVAA